MSIYSLDFKDTDYMYHKLTTNGCDTNWIQDIVQKLLLNDVTLLDELAFKISEIPSRASKRVNTLGVDGSRNRWTIPLLSVLLNELLYNPKSIDVEYAILANFKILCCQFTISPKPLFIRVADAGYELMKWLRGDGCENSSK